MDVQKVLGTREVFWFSKKQFEVNPMWGDDSELANWKLYHVAHYTYALHREAFLEYRRATRRTDAALAEAQAEVARLRLENDLLRGAVINAKFDVRYVKNYGRNMQWETCERNLNATYLMLSRIIERTNPALETAPAGEATNGNG